MNSIKLFRIILAFALVIAGLPVNAQKLNKNQFNNPIAMQRADPHVWKAADGTYYFIATVPEYDRIEIRKSKTINGIRDAQPVVIWRKHDKGSMSNHKEVYDNLVKALEHQDHPFTSAFDGLKTVEAIEKIYKAVNAPTPL